MRYELIESGILTNIVDFQKDDQNMRNANRIPSQELSFNVERLQGEIDSLKKRRTNLISLASGLDDEEDRRDVQNDINSLRNNIKEKELSIKRLNDLISSENATNNENINCIEEIRNHLDYWQTCTDDNKVFTSRANIASTMRRFINLLTFDFDDGIVCAYVAGFTKVYQFNKIGEIFRKQNFADAYIRSEASIDIEFKYLCITRASDREALLRALSLSDKQIKKALEAIVKGDRASYRDILAENGPVDPMARKAMISTLKSFGLDEKQIELAVNSNNNFFKKRDRESM